jgi:hypothetical protein
MPPIGGAGAVLRLKSPGVTGFAALMPGGELARGSVFEFNSRS